MGIVTLILSIITALPKIISLVWEIWKLIGGIRKSEPIYSVADQAADEEELRVAVGEYKRTGNVSRLEKLHARLHERRFGRV